MQAKKAILLIMDGWGLGKSKQTDAIQAANTPFVDALYDKYPHTTLVTYGESVGLPDGQMGNSEVGHLNLGAGRIVYQELQRINVAIREKTFHKNAALLDAIHKAKNGGKPLHLLGLVSDGGVHSHINHLKAIIDVCKEQGLKNVFVHAFTDGRDCDPHSGKGFIKELLDHMKATGIGQIASITGRYYAMDRDKRWERVRLAYDAIVHGKGELTGDLLLAIDQSYKNEVTDEFIKPIINQDLQDNPDSRLSDGDVAICFNFRTDRCREITQVLTQEDFPDFGMQKLDIDYTTMTEYNKAFKGVHVIFQNEDLNNTIGEVLESNGKKQIRIAETEKYPHVTFFFSGGREKEFEGEKRIIAASPKVATYDLQPEMSAGEITAKILPEINEETADFICLNFANTDMVGHTGVFSAVVKAAETVDNCVAQIVPAALAHGYNIFLTADHGNADNMVNPDGTPNTQHSVNLVPLFLITNDYKGPLKAGKLGDVAPSILKSMDIAIPKEMTGTPLF
ncbi:2,3-bisphosphoglycerate-independent phosphoglycerate mutase [Arachidicoccus terrestris]|uniref:2,3-bisphosphoglycerate-independent phosphoglycerate mutase n=1 Tax=Arachidicoccus terrestris TaxID=2875539 RepID=UPI001CC69091|nr:2,3-bisphosphoglycerate-independent phosphoglycerate mutase [Arachidicoccus terrestris]UAY56314.1 2,3-bisphosphoglycerate-independent phosphoglycerate mutase [Arachidicoccus terrestris]